MVWSLLIDNVIKWDPEYFEDFWTVPGYLGFDAPSSLEGARIQHPATITRTITSGEAQSLGLPIPLTLSIGEWTEVPVAFELDSLPDGSLQGAALKVMTGAAVGHLLYVTDVMDGVVLASFGEEHAEGLTGLAVGDDEMVDNGIFLAAQT